MRRALVALIAIASAACTQEGRVLGSDTGLRADALAAGPYHTCVIASGVLSCWGRGDHHQLGAGEATDGRAPRKLDGADWAEVAAGEQHTCARRTGGSVWCWGDNSAGQAGVGPIAEVDAPAFVSTTAPAAQIATTHDFTCAIVGDGALYCWGANAEGQLAQDDPFPGEGVPSNVPVAVGTAADWTQVDTGQGHACGLRAPGVLWCWGRNSGGHLGLGPDAAGQIRVPQRVGDADDWLEVRAGQNGTCARRAPGTLWCWGENSAGEVGTGDRVTRDVPTQVGEAADWSAITLDTFHGCGLRPPGTLWCWGRNFEGQLGLGDHEDRLVPTRVGQDEDWSQVSAGRFHTCARKSDGTLYCAGQNTYGQLGTGDVMDHPSFTRVGK
ncbi:MAG: hypothetical protein QM820_21055 [Minicystis sp.]